MASPPTLQIWLSTTRWRCALFSSKTQPIRLIRRSLRLKFASIKLSNFPPPQKATGRSENLRPARTVFLRKSRTSRCREPSSEKPTTALRSRRERPAYRRIRRHRRRGWRSGHARRNHRLEPPVKRQRNRADTPENRREFHPATHMRNRGAQS